MRSFRGIVIGIAALLVLLVGLRLTVFAPRPDDQKLIAQALDESLEAAKEGRPSVVLDRLSARFQINNASPGSRWDIAKFIRESKPEVVIHNRTATVSGDKAQIVTPVRVKVSYLNQNFDLQANDVTLVFEREEDREWLVIPTREWKLTDVVVPEGAVNLPEFSGGSWGGSMFGGL